MSELTQKPTEIPTPDHHKKDEQHGQEPTIKPTDSIAKPVSPVASPVALDDDANGVITSAQ